jgi:methylenetetrahydrofolate reductase (NADPH)
VGTELGTQMCRDLIAGGAVGLHFYTLNLEVVTNAILKNLGLYVE